MGQILWYVQVCVCVCAFACGILYMYVCVCERESMYLSEVKFEAEVITSSCDWTSTGIFRQPGDLRTLMSSFMVS